jgi:hypothetical protein
MNTKQILKSLKKITCEITKVEKILKQKHEYKSNQYVKKIKPEVIHCDDEYIKRIIRNGGL